MMRKVVIIDDEPWTRGVILRLGQWEQLGLAVVGEAADGEVGLELIHKLLPDIIITDVRMPRLGGIELVQRLRAENYNVPILIVSGYDDFAYVRSALKLGVTDYLLKPVKAQELHQQLLRCIEALDRQEISKPVMQAGFFADGWVDRYGSIRRQLEAALQVGNCGIISQQFGELQAVLLAHEGEKPAMPVMIGVYYSMLYPLQLYIDSVGLAKGDALGASEPVFVFSRENTVGELVHFLETLYLGTVRAVEQHRQSRLRLDIEAVCKYVQKNYTTGLTLERTADAFHVTKEYLSKAFKAHRGEGFTEYVTSLRMERAYELITRYRAPIKEAGAMVGYYDLAHFYKTFKKYYGKTPGEIRDGLKIDKATTP